MQQPACENDGGMNCIQDLRASTSRVGPHMPVWPPIIGSAGKTVTIVIGGMIGKVYHLNDEPALDVYT